MQKAEDRAVRLITWLELLNEREDPVPVQELIELARRRFGITEVTLRSDLAALCAWTGIRKLGRGEFGAGKHSPDSIHDTLFSTRLLRNTEAKLAIARAVVARLRQRNDLRVLLLDAGTTTFYVADLLSELKGLDLIVWTPNVAAAARLAGTRGVSVRLLGGEYHRDYAAVSGDETVRALLALTGLPPDEVPSGRYPGTHCVLDVNRLAPSGSLLIDESQERRQKAVMASLAEDVTIVADSGKLFRPSLGLDSHEVLQLFQLQTAREIRLVTDSACSPAMRQQVLELLARFLSERETTVEAADGSVAWTVGPASVSSQP